VTTVWVEYRPEPPVYTATEWSNADTYAEGALVWDADGSGHVFKALGAVEAGTLLTVTASWERVPVLACLAEAIKAGMTGAYHASEGQHGTARVKESYMLDELEHELIKIQNQEQETRGYNR
jgi:hypothetical protein